jgi:hypothetical protein
MGAPEHNKILALSFGAFSLIFAFTFLLLMLLSLGVFVSLGVTSANTSGDNNELGIGILGGAFAVLFYSVLGIIFVMPTAVASLKMLRGKRQARIWGIIAALAVVTVLPLGTALAVYAFWFLFSAEGKRFYFSSRDDKVIEA